MRNKYIWEVGYWGTDGMFQTREIHSWTGESAVDILVHEYKIPRANVDWVECVEDSDEK